MNKTKNRKNKNYKRLFIGILFAILLIWWGITFLRALIEHYSFDEKMKEYWDTTKTEAKKTYDYNFSPTGELVMITEYKSKESKLYMQAIYLPQKSYSEIECEVDPISKLIQNWIYLFKGGSWNRLSKEYVFTCHQQDISETGRKLAEKNYRRYGHVNSLNIVTEFHEPGDNVNCDDAISHSYSLYEGYKCNYNAPGYNSDIGCIKNECIKKGDVIIEKSYDEYGILREEKGPQYTKKFDETGGLYHESKGDYDNLKLYSYTNGRLVSEKTSKKGKFQEMKNYDPDTGDITYEVYFKDGKPSYGYKYQNGNKIPMTNSHLQEQFGRLLGNNQTFEE